MSLTPSQSAAVNFDQHLILFAGPGSGKTATSVAKGMRILSQSPDHYLCMVTFTAASAAEMKHRMQSYAKAHDMQAPGNRLIAGTFHALALRHYNEHAPTRKKLISSAQRDSMIYSMLAAVDIEERPDYIQALERYQGAIHQEAVEFASEDHWHFIDDYHSRMETSGSIDLSMVMRDCVTMMRKGIVPLLPVTHLIGDEMQDADEVQLEMVLVHAANGVTTTLVADDDQTIYEWRSALGYAGLQHFAKEAKAKTIALRENFRSRSEVLHHAKLLIAHNDPERIDKQQVAVRGPGGMIGARSFGGPKAQADFIVNYALNQRQAGESVAVLARTNVSLRVLSVVLYENEIPFVQDGRSVWDEPHVAVGVALLNALTKAEAGLLQPFFSLMPLSLQARKALERAIGRHPHDFLDGVPPEVGCTAVEAKAIRDISSLCARWRNKISLGEVNLLVPEVFDEVYNVHSSHLRSSKATETSVRSQLKRISSHLEDAQRILLKLRGTLSQRMNTLSRLTVKDQPAEALQLLTMHRSKGLEFDTVFLIDANEIDDGKRISHEHAERRLFYVAITRAKERFFALSTDQTSEFVYEAELPNLNGDL